MPTNLPTNAPSTNVPPSATSKKKNGPVVNSPENQNQRIAQRAESSIHAVEQVLKHRTSQPSNSSSDTSSSSSSSSSISSATCISIANVSSSIPATSATSTTTTTTTTDVETTKLRNLNELSPSTSKSPPPSAVRKVPELGALSKQQYLLVLKDKLAAISR